MPLNSEKLPQWHSQNLKQVPQNFMKVFYADVIMVIMSYRKINIVSEKIINYRVTSPGSHCCQIRTWVEKDLEFQLYTISKTRTRSCRYFFFTWSWHLVVLYEQCRIKRYYFVMYNTFVWKIEKLLNAVSKNVCILFSACSVFCYYLITPSM